MNYVYCYLSYYGYKAGQATMQGFWDEMARLGKDRNPYRAGFLQFVALAEDDDHAEELYGEAALYFYDRCMHVGAAWASPPGYSTDSTVRRGLGAQIKQVAERSAGPAPPQISWKSIVDNGFILAGSPKTVIEQMNQMASDLNVGHQMLLLHFGNLKKETVLYNTRRFARDVAPVLRPRFSEWEDRWWPKTPAPQLVAAQ